MRLSTDTSSNAKLSSLANPTAPGVRTRTPTQTLADWTSALNQVVLSNRTETLAFLQQLSSGLAVDEDSADEVFNELIAKEAYGVFVEAFNAYCDILQSHADADGKPFTSRLVLRLPLGWLPRSLEVMRAALATLKVGCVEVHPPPLNLQDDFERQMYVAARRSNTPLERPISNGACQLVELLLQNGATELVVAGGSLEDLDRVRSAMEASSALQSLTLGKMRAEGLEPFEYQGYLGLLETAQACPRLTQLTLLQSELLTGLEDGRVPHLPNLQSLTMRGGTAASSPALCAFLKSFSPSGSLTKVSLSFRNEENDMQLPTVLRSLEGHHSLTELALTGASGREQTCEDMIEALEVALSCPSMQSITQDTGLYVYVRIGLDRDVPPDLLERVRKIGQRLESPSCPLRSLSLRGFVIHETVLDILCEAIAKNKSLETLDLTGCGINIASMKKLMKALESNTTLRNVVWPTDPGDYYFVVNNPKNPEDPNESVYRFHWMHPDIVPSHTGNVFRLKDAPDGVFDAESKDLAETFQQRLVDRQMALLRHDALPELALDLGRMLAATAQSHPKLVADGLTSEGTYVNVAARVAGYLEERGALRDIVRVSQTKKRNAEGKPVVYATQREKSVKPFVRLNNRSAAAQEDPSARGSYNERDKRGANVHLMDAVRDNDRKAVSWLLAEGADDFRDQAKLSAPRGPLRDAFLFINRVDKNGANAQLIAAVKAGDVPLVKDLRARRATDYGRQALALAQEIGSDALCAALVKDTPARRRNTKSTAPNSNSSSNGTTTTTTTATTLTTTTTEATLSRYRQTRVPRRNPDKPGA